LKRTHQNVLGRNKKENNGNRNKTKPNKHIRVVYLPILPLFIHDGQQEIKHDGNGYKTKVFDKLYRVKGVYQEIGYPRQQDENDENPKEL